MTRILRYAAPNLITTVGLLFGLASVIATHEHRFVAAAWLIIWAVLLDKLDGLVARTLKATSAFGVQMDSFADFFNFGCAPAFLVFVSLGDMPGAGLSTGPGRVLLMVACTFWVLGNLFRLARFNVVSERPGAPMVFFGVPTTLMAGTLVIWYLACSKYAPPGSLVAPVAFGGPKLIPGLELPVSIWRWFPPAMLVGALLMVSNLPMPKLGRARTRAGTVTILGLVVLGYVLGFARWLPEVMALLPTTWLVVFVIRGQLSRELRHLEPPPVFPVGFAGSEDEDEAVELEAPSRS